MRTPHVLFAAVWLALTSATTCAQAVWNPNDKGSLISISPDGRDATNSSVGFQMVRAVQGRSSGKRCFDLYFVAADAAASVLAGVANANASLTNYPGASSSSVGTQWQAGGPVQPYVSGVMRANGFTVATTAVAGDVLMVCVDFSTGSAWLGRNGAWATGNPASGTAPTVTGISGTWFPAVGPYNGANVLRLRGYAAELQYLPSGFNAWSDGNPPPSPLWVFPSNSPYPIQAPVWKKAAGSAEIYYNAGPVRQPVGPGNTSTCWSASGSCVLLGPAQGQWMTVDLTASPWNVPADAAWAELRGIGGHTGGPAAAGVVYRRPSDASVECSVPNYAVQFLGESDGSFGGLRSNGTVRVPLVGGRFEFCWLASYLNNGASFFWNPSITGWARAEPEAPLGLMATTTPKKHKPAPKKAIQGWCLGTLCFQ